MTHESVSPQVEETESDEYLDVARRAVQGESILIVSSTDVGAGTLGTDFALRTATGRPLGDIRIRQGRVHVCRVEHGIEQQGLVQGWLKQEGVAFPATHYSESFGLDLADDVLTETIWSHARDSSEPLTHVVIHVNDPMLAKYGNMDGVADRLLTIREELKADLGASFVVVGYPSIRSTRSDAEVLFGRLWSAFDAVLHINAPQDGGYFITEYSGRKKELIMQLGEFLLRPIEIGSLLNGLPITVPVLVPSEDAYGSIVNLDEVDHVPAQPA